MRMRSLLFLAVLVAGGVGVWAGVAYGGTENGRWIERLLGAAMILIGASMILSRDTFNRANPQLTGAGFAILGVSYLVPSGWLRIATGLVALGVMVVPIVRRRRAAAARPSG